jgi:predicted Zn-dependent protease
MATAVRRWFMPLLVYVMGVLLAACQSNPTTGRQQWLLLSLEQEAQLGKEAKPQMLQEMGPAMGRAEINAYVEGVGRRLLARALPRDPRMASLDWEFIVLDNDVINAFALPGGKVFISRGLMQKLSNEAQLAAVVGHEIGHVFARHGNERVSQTLTAQLGLAIAAEALAGSESGQIIAQVAENATELFLLAYSRDQESESDMLGAAYMVEESYDPMGAVQVMELFVELSGGKRQPEILSTHPDPARRAENLRRRIAEDYAFTQGNPAYSLREKEYRDGFLSRYRAAYPHAGEPTFAGAGAIVPQGAVGVLIANHCP